MKFLPIALLLISLVTIFVGADPDQTWKKHKAKHGIKDNDDEPKRKALFDQTDVLIRKHNSGNQEFSVGHNQFSHLTGEERHKYFGLKPVQSFDRSFHLKDEYIYEDRQTYPTTYDLRTNSTCINPIRNQGECGCCWAFSATATIEYAQCKNKLKGVKVLLSEQQLVDCANSENGDFYDFGCDGGHYVNVWYYYHIDGAHGAATNASYGPYTSGTTAVAGTCKQSTATMAATINGVYKVANTTSAIQNALYNKGVLSASLYVEPDAGSTFMVYSSGVYSDPNCNAHYLQYGPNHAVNLIGWTKVNQVNAWIMRNSWATTWGMQGYMYIKWGSCGIEQDVFFATVA